MSIMFSPLAMADLKDIGDYIAEDNAARADTFVDKILDRCIEIDRAPERYVARPEIGSNIRSIAFKDYMIFYTYTDNIIRIERIVHGSRDYLGDKFYE